LNCIESALTIFLRFLLPLHSLAADHDRLDLAREELHALLASEELARACVLVYANKQDLPKAASAAELSETLALHSIRDHDWHIQACSALNGTGLYEGLDWVTARLKELNSA
jgi:signal recognition particle receptor subunit beta